MRKILVNLAASYVFFAFGVESSGQSTSAVKEASADRWCHVELRAADATRINLDKLIVIRST